MMSEEISEFYNKESLLYSKKRYEEEGTYIKFFFRKRLDIILRFLKKEIDSDEGRQIRILDVGCADGYVLQRIDMEFPERFSEMVGIDIAGQMIEVANLKNKKEYISFFSRDKITFKNKFDIILEVGFLSPPLFEFEFEFVKKHLNTNGYFICSLGSRNSLHAWAKLRRDGKHEYVNEYFTYSKYEEVLRRDFEIIAKEPYGFFVPKLWACPRIARVIQPVCERFFYYLAPSLFHEKLYLLKLKEA